MGQSANLFSAYAGTAKSVTTPTTNLPGDSSLASVITREEAIFGWQESILPFIRQEYEQDGEPDYVARSESFSNYADMLCKSGDSSEWQYMNWTHPIECGQ